MRTHGEKVYPPFERLNARLRRLLLFAKRVSGSRVCFR
jgi:hypothetical protein